MSPNLLLLKELITELQFDTFSSEIRMEPTTVKNMKMKWLFRGGFIEAAPRLAEEFKIVRSLAPTKIAVIGPPFSGKTALAKRLAEVYGVRCISSDQVWN